MRKILVIDDEPRVTEACQDAFLYEEEYEVICTNDGKEGITLIRESKPDLVLLDWRLNGAIEGKDVLLFSKKEFPHIPVYVVTASVHLKKEIESLGADKCLLKPNVDIHNEVRLAFSSR
jgi:DNA-binding response OmpR family regulator